MTQDIYKSPLTERYASSQMSYLFSAQFRSSTWRRLWLALAQAQKELGLAISQEQIDELSAHLEDIDLEKVRQYEQKLHHDVMAHIHAYADQCPKARPIIHLGATSCFVTDNGDLIQMREGLKILHAKLVQVLRQFSLFAKQHARLPCLAFTHFQAAQPTTVGKRCCLWMQDFLLDLSDMEWRMNGLRFLGLKGATGTQASFLSLFENDPAQVEVLDKLVAKKMGFPLLFTISGQTYARKQDIHLLDLLSGIAVSAHKFATDLRLLSHLKEIEEPLLGEHQVGSSAMPYKRNPMLSERICALSRFVISLGENPKYTASTQWLERTLDDSANRRLSLSEAFLATDAILDLMITITSGLEVYPKMMEKHLKEELPFIATENILMACVKKGGDRQQLHEQLRQHSREAGKKVKQEGSSNDLLERISKDPIFGLTKQELDKLMQASHFIGRAPEQVEEFLNKEIQPVLEKQRK